MAEQAQAPAKKKFNPELGGIEFAAMSPADQAQWYDDLYDYWAGVENDRISRACARDAAEYREENELGGG
jgi:hypothetical protein